MSALRALLLPFHWLFAGASVLRRTLYEKGVLSSTRLCVPVVIVGNLVVGGTGKTPIVIALAQELRKRGWRPGMLSRGYGRNQRENREVQANSAAGQVGDEPLLLARGACGPVWVGRDRAAAGAALLAQHPQVNVLICDDGMQHFKLQRDLELVVWNRTRLDGNRLCLPVGPLREPIAAARRALATIWNGSACSDPEREVALSRGLPTFSVEPQPFELMPLRGPDDGSCTAPTIAPSTFAGQSVVAACGIADPERFARSLESLGLVVQRRFFSDHHLFSRHDLDELLSLGGPIVVTEKDAVKLIPLLEPHEKPNLWCLRLQIQLPSELVNLVEQRLRTHINATVGRSGLNKSP